MNDIFIGRTAQLETLEKRIRGIKDGYRQNIAILGDEMVGKTSLIFTLLNKSSDNYIIPVYLEIRPESLALFGKRFIGVLLYNFLLNSGMDIKEDLDFLLKKSCAYIPKTAERINLVLEGLEKRRKENVFTELLSLGESIHQETGKFCVFIFDEFHNLESLGVKNIYSEWSRLLLMQKTVMYIITSSFKYKAESVLSKELSLLFGNFEVINIEPFDIKSSNAYLDLRFSGLDVDVGLKNFLIYFTGGVPFYLDVISEALLRYNPDRLVDILEDLLSNPAGILNQKFANYLKSFQNDPCSLNILYLVSCGHNKIKDIAHLIRKPKKDALICINRLLFSAAISRNADFLKINDRIFSFWLRFVYNEKIRSFTFDDKSQKALFKKNIESMLIEFKQTSGRPVNERMMELLRLFDDDLVQVERKKMRLSHFREIKPLELRNRSLRDGLICRSQDSL
ncbi:ATP-binding protein, partial [bacterium]